MKLLSKEAAAIAVAVCVAVGLLYLTMRPRGETTSTKNYPEEDTAEHDQSRVSYYKSQICSPKKIYTKCTLLAPTYKRVRMLPVFLDNYCNMTDSLESIVMVWNDIESPIPPSVLKLAEKCKIDLRFIAMKTNKLSNRFLPGDYLKEIRTECKYCSKARPR